MKFSIKFIAPVLVAAGLMSGCSHRTAWVYNHTPAQLEQRSTQLSYLKYQGIRVFVQGESVRIILPSNLIFEGPGSSDKITGVGQELVGHVAHFIKTFDVVRVSVNAYADAPAWKGTVHNPHQKLTNSQSQAIAKQLWSSGINMRMITAKGMASNNSVSWNGTPRGRNDNRRVEVSFRFYPHKINY